jgi:hypothetical protein
MRGQQIRYDLVWTSVSQRGAGEEKASAPSPGFLKNGNWRNEGIMSNINKD